MFYKFFFAALLSLYYVDQSSARSTYQAVCEEDQFQCYNSEPQECIPNFWVCDHANDCDNGEDELNCHNRPHCRGGDFMCSDRACIPDDWKCDDETDCDDGSDEDDALCQALRESEEQDDSNSQEDSQEVPQVFHHQGHHGNRHHGDHAFRHARRQQRH